MKGLTTKILARGQLDCGHWTTLLDQSFADVGGAGGFACQRKAPLELAAVHEEVKALLRRDRDREGGGIRARATRNDDLVYTRNTRHTWILTLRCTSQSASVLSECNHYRGTERVTKNGGPDRTRICDLLGVNEAL